MINTLRKLIEIPSVMDKSSVGAPFGENCRIALDEFLHLAKDIGLKTFDNQGYYGWAEYGEGEKLIGIACHIDVVPATGDWTTPPYTLSERDGIIYGRGVADDKGPIAVCLKLMEKWKKENVKFDHRIRLIVGCNEENGSLCMKHYVENDEIPSFTLVPDADFPVVNSEKGILHFNMQIDATPFTSIGLKSFSGGKRPNIVCDYVVADVEKGSKLHEAVKAVLSDKNTSSELFALLGVKNDAIKAENDYTRISAYGIAGHAMCPDRGVNAIYILYRFLAHVSSVSVNFADQYFSVDVVKNMGVYAADEQSGDLTANLGIIELKDKNFVLTYDLRLPICSDHEEILKAFTSQMVGKISDHSYTPNLFISKDSKEIQALVESYCTVTGDAPHCVHTGGGTYARTIPNAVAYGPTFEGRETNIHNADECIPLADLYKLFDIYDIAVRKIDKIVD